MKIKFKGRKGVIRFEGEEGRKLVKHIEQGGSFGDIMIPKFPSSIKEIELSTPLILDACEICHGTGDGHAMNEECELPGKRKLMDRISAYLMRRTYGWGPKARTCEECIYCEGDNPDELLLEPAEEAWCRNKKAPKRNFIIYRSSNACGLFRSDWHHERELLETQGQRRIPVWTGGRKMIAPGSAIQTALRELLNL
ncbi:MAG: hypothetical protein ABSF90_10445 [Syntrophobacteraceae bacterium]|jgi:hypothetical protein